MVANLIDFGGITVFNGSQDIIIGQQKELSQIAGMHFEAVKTQGNK